MLYPGRVGLLVEESQVKCNIDDDSVERSLVRLESAIWSLMVGEPKKKTATKSLPIVRKARGETSELFHGFTGNAKDPQKFSSAQSVALNLWSKRHCSAEKRNENFILSKNNAIVNEIEGSSTVEYKTIRETLAEQRGRLEEFNLLCYNVEASLKAFWSR